MARFAPLLESTVRALAGWSTAAIPLPVAYAQARRDEKQGELILDSHFVEVSGRGELRGVCIASPKIDIITLFFFPRPGWQLPVYAMEFVVLGTRPIVGVIDAVCLAPMACAGQVQTAMSMVHARFPGLAQADDPPDWYVECRSGLDFFVRPRDLTEVAELEQAHLAVWRETVTLLDEPARFVGDDISHHHQRLRDYKHHHRVNSPGLRLLNRSFGVEWTERYLRDHLFR